MRAHAFVTRFLMLVGLALCGAVAQAEAGGVSAVITDATVIVRDGVADATFRVVADNGDDVDALGVTVVFADGTALLVGDVPAGGSARSGVESRAIDITATPTRNVPVNVTLRYSSGGRDVAEPVTLTLTVEE